MRSRYGSPEAERRVIQDITMIGHGTTLRQSLVWSPSAMGRLGIFERGDQLRVPAQHAEGLLSLCETRPDGQIQLVDTVGRVVATMTLHRAPTRPQDMPRHLRPKERLSKRQRDAAKREKLLRAA